MKKLLYTISALAVLATTACRKYVEISPVNVRELKYTKDYQGLLYNSLGLMEKNYLYPLYASDEVWTADGTVWQTNLNINAGYAYCWLPKIWTETQEDQDWANQYTIIYNTNLVVNEVMSSEGGTDADKIKAYAEALVHRAHAYYTLVNVYAKQYDSTTAATDPGVPVVLQTNFSSNLKRVSVAGVYDQIVSDLQTALPNLAPTPDVITNPSQAAVYAMLSKVYLHKREFTKAGLYADSALQLKNTLVDLNAYAAAPATYPGKMNDPENIFSKTVNGFLTTVPLSNDLMNLFDTINDLRYKLFTLPGASIGGANFTNRGYYKHRLVNQGIYVGPKVPEMMLIKAECEARAGNTSTAVSILNNLRKKRLVTTGYTDLTATDAQQALQLVITERRKELMGTGARWFDQRRLQKDNGFISTVSRPFKGVIYTLEPGSNEYTFAISDKYILLNPEIEQNPR
ncbi:MAG: RagB/SusD family nutrient uptake outer membrane protein [Niastella sp.]|uniref:RagB/SusD family nutrient uptake outer membrane protein n=1 Tax=Niastella sp. TaxID=1869183 RepID=UPI00389AD778